MDKIKVKIYSETGVIPEYKTSGSAGFDLAANVKQNHKAYLCKEYILSLIKNTKVDFDNGECKVWLDNQENLIIGNYINSAYGNPASVNNDYKQIAASVVYLLLKKYRDVNTIPEMGIIVVPPYWSGIIPTGIRMEIPEGYELQIRPRSGINAKTLISAKVGTVDSDYRGDIGIVLQNKSSIPFIIEHGDRLAQGVFNKVPQADFEVVESPEDLMETERGEGGFGSTGVK